MPPGTCTHTHMHLKHMDFYRINIYMYYRIYVCTFTRLFLSRRSQQKTEKPPWGYYVRLILVRRRKRVTSRRTFELLQRDVITQGRNYGGNKGDRSPQSLEKCWWYFLFFFFDNSKCRRQYPTVLAFCRPPAKYFFVTSFIRALEPKTILMTVFCCCLLIQCQNSMKNLSKFHGYTGNSENCRQGRLRTIAPPKYGTGL